MPKYYATNLQDLEKSIREEQAIKQAGKPLGELAGLIRRVGETGEKVKERREAVQQKERSTAKDFFNTYATLRSQGFSSEQANIQSRQMTGYKGKDFVSPGFEEQTKRKLGIAQEKAQLGLEKERVGIEKTKAETAKLGGEASKLEAETRKLGASGQFTSEQVKNAATLRKEFDANRAVKNFDVLNRSVKGLRQALDLSLTGESRIASDQALGVLFQKMLDPDSVVRESEYARTPEGAALLSRLEGFIPKLAKGGLALSNDDRKAIVEMGEKLLEEGIDTYNKEYDRFSNLAEISGTSPRLIFGDVLKRIEKPSSKTAEPESVPRGTVGGEVQEFATEEEMEAANLPTGTPVIVGGVRGRVG